MKKYSDYQFILILLLLSPFISSAATFYSAGSGDWDNPTTWTAGTVPGDTDEVIISDGHIVTKSGASYTHKGNLTIKENAELIASCGNSAEGLTINGGTVNVFGKLTLPFPDRDLDVRGTSLFIGHPSAIIFVSDDWEVFDNAEIVINGICVEVDDDFTVSGTTGTVCGNGGVSIGNNSNNNTFNLVNGATDEQLCLETEVYRGPGGSCETLITSGSGNGAPTAYDDFATTDIDNPVSIDILFQDKPDTDPNSNDTLKIVSIGPDMAAQGDTSIQGGTILVDDNGTPDHPGDDFVFYTPPAGFQGVDSFYYVITDQQGGYSTALVTVTVENSLPVSWTDFYGREAACEMVLNWITASEQNNDYFEIEKSSNGRDFTAIGRIDGSGTTAEMRQYKFIDPLPNTQNYYRIKQVDFDGKFDYSTIISQKSRCIENDENIGIATLFPNPSMSTTVNLRFNARQIEDTFLRVSDLFGKVLINRAVTVQPGMNNVTIDITDFPAGSYSVWLGKKSQRLVTVRP